MTVTGRKMLRRNFYVLRSAFARCLFDHISEITVRNSWSLDLPTFGPFHTKHNSGFRLQVASGRGDGQIRENRPSLLDNFIMHNVKLVYLWQVQGHRGADGLVIGSGLNLDCCVVFVVATIVSNHLGLKHFSCIPLGMKEVLVSVRLREAIC